MAKKATKSGGKSLVIVESPAKARTISKFLGGDYEVQASIGHVRDLPKGTREIPAQYKGEEWAYLGVNVNEGFVPIYVVPADKKAQVAKLRNAIKIGPRPVPGDGRGPRRRGHQLAPVRAAQAQDSGPSPGVSRDHEGSDRRGPGQSAGHRRGAGAGPGNAADPGPALWL